MLTALTHHSATQNKRTIFGVPKTFLNCFALPSGARPRNRYVQYRAYAFLAQIYQIFVVF